MLTFSHLRAGGTVGVSRMLCFIAGQTTSCTCFSSLFFGLKIFKKLSKVERGLIILGLSINKQTENNVVNYQKVIDILLLINIKSLDTFTHF